MQNDFAFLGLGIESGQTHKGLRESAHFAKILLAQKFSFEDLGNIYCNQVYQVHKSETSINADIMKTYISAHEYIVRSLEDENFHLNWGGDHSIGLSTVSAFTKVFPDGWVVWIDAHADLNTPEASLTGNLHGMPLAFLLGIGGMSDRRFSEVLNPKKLIYVGLRDVDPFEEKMIRKLGITAYTMKEIRRWGIEQVIDEIRRKVGRSDVHISFDIDSVDPDFAPSTGVLAHGGLTPTELLELGDGITSVANIRSVDIAEINPTLGSAFDVAATYQIGMLFFEKILDSRKRLVEIGPSRQDSFFDYLTG